MTVKDLRRIIANLPDETPVFMPGEPMRGFTGVWISPCVKDSGIIGVSTEDLDDDDIKQRELLNQEIPTQDILALIPCGFLDELGKDHVHPELN